ncbi:MAG: MaoC family dehydratase [Alphaproteobacteria bacterium]|nr:MaoC family dehydratase [Alphaproteobacteria bacterium]
MSNAAQSSAGQGIFFEDLTEGRSASITKTVTEADIVKFAEVTGDTNPIHLDEAYAAATRFKARIAHGMLSAGYISAVFGTRMPGPGAIYVSQLLKFRAPVKIGDAVTTTVEVTARAPEKKFVTFKTQCMVGATVVVDGEATLMVPARG